MKLDVLFCGQYDKLLVSFLLTAVKSIADTFGGFPLKSLLDGNFLIYRSFGKKMSPLEKFNNFANSKLISMKFLRRIKDPILHKSAKFHAIHSLTFEKMGDLLKAPRFLTF